MTSFGSLLVFLLMLPMYKIFVQFVVEVISFFAQVPEGQWFCGDCRPKETRRSERKKKPTANDKDEEEENEQSNEKKEESEEISDEDEADSKSNSYQDESEQSKFYRVILFSFNLTWLLSITSRCVNTSTIFYFVVSRIFGD